MSILQIFLRSKDFLKITQVTAFSYIVTGVIFVYNDSSMILLCIFAVYGVYAMLRELVMLLVRKKRAVVAIRISADMERDACIEAIRFAEQFAEGNRHVERGPVLLCDAGDPDKMQGYGYEIYVKRTVAEEECRQN